MVYETTAKINQVDIDEINNYLHNEPASKDVALLEDDSISAIISFPNHKKMEISCKGVQYRKGNSNVAYTEAILSDNGKKVYCTPPMDYFNGTWKINYKGDTYIANLVIA